VTPPKFEILAYEATKLGLICLRRRELLSRPGTIVTEITLNHEFLMSSYITDSERSLARFALDMHRGEQLSVLVGGLGLGFTAHEVLVAGGDRVARVEVVEYLPQVIEWLAQDLVPLARELKADARLVCVEGDVYERLSSPSERKYDLILIDVDHSPDEHLGGESGLFYTEAGLQRARQHLTDAGILAVWSYAEHSPFTAALHRVFRNVRLSPVTVMNDLVDEEQTDWLFFAQN
jgi:spermidine synthase